MTKLCVPFLFFLLCSTGLQAQIFKTSVSVLGNLNNGPYFFKEGQRDFATRKSSFNPGVAVGLSWYPLRNQSWYVASGIRLNTAAALLSRTYIFSNVSATSKETVNWNYRWQELTIPLHFGRTFVPFKNSSFYIDAYAGVSYGIIIPSMEGFGSETEATGDSQVPFEITTQSNTDDDLFTGRSLTTLDAGFRFNPIPKLPNLSIGFLFSYNIQETKNIKGSGFIETQNARNDYNFNMARRFNNYTFSLSYAFGGKWKKDIIGKAARFRPGTQIDCPEVH